MKNVLEKFYKKIDEDYTAYFSDVKNMDSSEIISNLKDIAAMQEVYETLKSNPSLNPDYLKYLLKFQNPLYVIKDYWMNGERVISENLDHTLWDIWDKADAEQDYPLERDIHEPEPQGEVRMC